MNDGAYAGLRLAARAGDPEPENNPDNQPEDEKTSAGTKKKEDDMSTANKDQEAAVAQAQADAKAEGMREANERFSKVLASEHYAGREPLAKKLLGNASLSADEIIETLSVAEKKADQQAEERANAEAAEEGGRKEMQAALSETKNSNIDAEGSGKSGPKADSSKIWDQAIAANNPGLKIG